MAQPGCPFAGLCSVGEEESFPNLEVKILFSGNPQRASRLNTREPLLVPKLSFWTHQKDFFQQRPSKKGEKLLPKYFSSWSKIAQKKNEQPFSLPPTTFSKVPGGDPMLAEFVPNQMGRIVHSHSHAAMTNDLAFLAAAHNAATLIKQWFVFKLSLIVDFYW